MPISLTLNLGARVMMQLGPIRFDVTSAAYSDMVRKSEYRWPTMERLGRPVAHQFMGVGEDEITLKGTIYPDYRPYGGPIRVGIGNMDAIRSLAEQGIPLDLITGYGDMLGRYCIKSVEDTGTIFYADGSPRKQDFTVELVKYGEDNPGLGGLVFSAGFFHIGRVQINAGFGNGGFGVNFGVSFGG